ncbi:hypothetical protein PIB30_094405 [Stylosanthes scabra]|uniref:Uncharacterized protein n=1 Tax=Stylosanthes scabra TaxID=79078 RepID=A0ABU6SW02_9FABA|nr:hypothetical protein [Stylosanthes scabra]
MTRVILGILVAPCDTSFKTFQTPSARDKGLSELQRTKVPAPSGRDMHNQVAKQRRQLPDDLESAMAYFEKLAARDQNLFYGVEKGKDGLFRHISGVMVGVSWTTICSAM